MGYKNLGLHILAIFAGLSIAAPARAEKCTESQTAAGYSDVAITKDDTTTYYCQVVKGREQTGTPDETDQGTTRGNHTHGQVWGPNGVAFGNGASVGVGEWTDPTTCDDEYSYDATDKTCKNGEATAAPRCAAGIISGGDKCLTNVKPVAGGTAVGAGTSVQADNGTAVGAGASVGEGHTGSTAIGAGAKTTQANQVMIGTDKDQITAPGIASHYGLGTALVTTDASGNLMNDGGYVYDTLANHGSRLDQLSDWRNIAEGQIATLQGDVKRLHRAIAVATALTIPHVDPDKRFALTVSGAGVDGEGAGAIAAAIKFDRNIQGFVGAGTSFSGGPAAVKGGVTFQW